MQIKSADFLTSALNVAACPEPTVPEMAFIGRSNVGKSSLLNLLTNRLSLARVSSTPGHTQLINYYTINGIFRLVDLPGYGYAKPLRNNPHKFEQMIVDYMTVREGLRYVFVLIDSRHEPHLMDVEFVQWMRNGRVPLALVFTKTDKLKRAQVDKNIAAFLEATGGWEEDEPPVFTTSAKEKTGRREILEFMGRALEA